MNKTLYFDINGTITFLYRCKPALTEGAFEQAVREAGFERLICMSNIQNTIRLLTALGKQPDSRGIIFDMCWGAFRDSDWFRRVTTLVPDPDHRARCIDLAADWWYMDDLAEEYLQKDGFANLYAANLGRRVLMPKPDSDGDEILRWLRDYGARSQAGNPRLASLP